MTQTITERLHIIEGSDWRDAVIALLDPKSPYRPWRYAFGETRDGDPLAVVLNTDPCSVLTALGYVGSDGYRGRAVIRANWPGTGLIDLDTMVMVAGLAYGEDPRYRWQLRDDAAIRMELALTDCKGAEHMQLRFGHTSLAAARILLHSERQCAGCDADIDLSGEDARDVVHIHTVDRPPRTAPESPVKVYETGSKVYDAVESVFTRKPYRLPADWPGVLCRRCEDRMRDSGYSSLVDFRVAQHPDCPDCGPSGPNVRCSDW